MLINKSRNLPLGLPCGVVGVVRFFLGGPSIPLIGGVGNLTVSMKETLLARIDY